MMISPGLFRRPRDASALSYLGKELSNTGLTTYTFSAFNGGGNGLGAAHLARGIIVGYAGAAGAARTLSSITVGGNAMTLKSPNTSSANPAGVAALLLPAGTTGNIALTFSAVMVRCGIFVWRAIEYDMAGIDAIMSNATGAQSLNVQTGSMAVGVAYDNSVSPTFSSGLTTRDTGASGANYAGGDVTGTGSGSISVDAAGTSFNALAAASFAQTPL